MAPVPISPADTAKKTMEYLRKSVPKLLSPWPANSPDLNPIENLWSIMTAQVYEEEIKSVHALKCRVLKLWRSLDPETLKALIADMPKRMKECIAAKGGAISR